MDSVSKILKIIEVIEKHKKNISTVYYDDFFYSSASIKDMHLYNKNIVSWVCFELDRSNYPTNDAEYRAHNPIVRIAAILNIDEEIIEDIFVYNSPEPVIRRLIALLYTCPLTEIIRHKEGLNKYQNYYS